MNNLNKITFKLILQLSAVAIVLFFLSSCTDHAQPNVELIQDMMESPAIKPQEFDASSPNNSGMRVPPEGTQPVGFTPYRYANDFTAAAKNQNPLAGNNSEAVLKIGLKYYSTNCMVCHGEYAEGSDKSVVAEKMALKPPSLLTVKIKSWTDGELYHVITMGQGVMGPYAAHIPQKYRWQVVNYIRTLQKENK